MTNNNKKSVVLTIVGSIIVILVAMVVLQEENKSPLGTPQELIVVEVDPVSMEIEEPLQMQFRDSIVFFAQQLLGVPYEYGSCEPDNGLDCSGFVYYVFDHFGIKCPRSSKNFAKAGRTVEMHELQKADVLVFTGTDENARTPGHVGIVLSVDDSVSFIHSSSGSADGVTISSLEEPHYRKRFLVARDLISI